MCIFRMLIFFSCYGFGCLQYIWYPRTIRPEGISWGHHIHFSDLEKVCNDPNKTITHPACFSSHHRERQGLEITARKPQKNNPIYNKTPKCMQYLFSGPQIWSSVAEPADITIFQSCLWLFHLDSVLLKLYFYSIVNFWNNNDHVHTMKYERQFED